MASHTNNPVLESPSVNSASQFSVEERRELIQRVAASEQLSRSARLRDFLLYVGRQSLKDGCPEINEQEIGAKVFGRPASYDRSQDNIVRVNATELRKRIESYFATTGAHEPVILEIPRGGYKPVFHRRPREAICPPDAAVEEHPPTAASALDAAKETRSHFASGIAHLVWPTASLVLAIALILLFLENRNLRSAFHPWTAKPAVGAFWVGFLRSPLQTVIVLPDSSVSLGEEFTHRPISLSQFLDHSDLSQIQSLDLSADRKSDLTQVFNHNLVTFGDVQAAQQIFALDPGSASLHLTVPRFFEADSLKNNNVILIGGKKANPWVFLFNDRINFSLDSVDSAVVVTNRHPQPGEQAIYSETVSQNGRVGYCVVAFLPNPSQTGNAIILAGTDSDSTNAAAEFLTSEDQLEKFRARLHTDRFPYFEALLKTSQVRGTSLGSELLAFRVYPDPHQAAR